MQINVANVEQQLLFELELKGQVSDGYWENARPHNHYQNVCKAKVVVDPDNIGIDFRTMRSYNFASPTLLEYVGDRMQRVVLLKRKFPTLSQRAIHFADNSEWAWNYFGKDNKDVYGEPKQEWKKLGVNTFDELQAVVANLDKDSYKLKDLRKDLKAINASFKNFLRT